MNQLLKAKKAKTSKVNNAINSLWANATLGGGKSGYVRGYSISWDKQISDKMESFEELFPPTTAFSGTFTTGRFTQLIKRPQNYTIVIDTKEKSEYESKFILDKLEELKKKDEQINQLRKNLESFLPHKRFFKASSKFVFFFSGCILSNTFLNVKIMEPFWSWIGLLIGFSFTIMSYCMLLDWEKKITNANDN
jgi:hypothetical protein